MRLMHTHHLAGPGKVIVSAPDLPVLITVDPNAEYRSADILADRGLGAWAGPSGAGGVALGIEVGRPTLKDTLKDKLGLRRGSSVSSGDPITRGSVRATGRGSVASGGSIENVALGKGSRVGGKERELPEVGVHITTPPGSVFQIKAARRVVVLRGSARVTLEQAQSRGWIGVVDQ